jgi:pimeloyl-ACP methyl ester carboxylesterase
MLCCKYLPILEQQLAPSGVSLVQTLLTSSLRGWGTSSISKDAEELNLLCRTLRVGHKSQGVVIVGHSTGCQDAVMYATKYKNDSSAAPLLGVVLQAPVSDREFLSMLPQTTEQTIAARKVFDEGRPDDIAFRAMNLDGAAVTASRWLSLAEPGGEDDMFSADLTDEELKEKLGGLTGVPTLLMLSSRDEYTHPRNDYIEMGNRMAKAIGPSARLAILEGANHAVSNHSEDAAELISEFVLGLVGK